MQTGLSYEAVRDQSGHKVLTKRHQHSKRVSDGFDDSGISSLQPVQELRVVKLLGTGGFGSVYLAVSEDRTFAVKRLHRSTSNPKAKLESYKAELRIIKLDHPNIVRYLGTTSTMGPENAFIIMEYAGDYNLQQLINNSNEKLDLERRIKYAYEMASALEYIHSKCIIHLDVKPSNMMITHEDTCKLCDFGCCQKVEIDTGSVSPFLRTYLTGTFAYRPPELLRGEPPTSKADIYSLGVTMWQMFSRESPYGNENQHVVIFGVVAYNLRPVMPQEDSLDDTMETLYRKLFIKCWSARPDQRPASADLTKVIGQWRRRISISNSAKNVT